jgi:soluble lytic murein transglycosylase-like protein
VRKSKILVGFAMLCSGLAPQVTVARNVDHISFNGPNAQDHAQAEPNGGIPFEPPSVAPDLTALIRFELLGGHSSLAAVPPDQSAIPLSTAHLRIPAWMRSTRSAAILSVNPAVSFTGGLTAGGYDRCDGRSYTPAWWLDAKTEARRAYYFDTMAAIACEYGVPTSLLDAVIAKESRYKYWAISPKGAMGMMQIMPGTADQLGLASPFDAVANIRAGARYLREQLDRFGRVDLALAAYNAGPHRRSLRAGKLPMIAETLDYVRTILTNWGRLTPRRIEVASVDRAAAASAAVAASPLRQVTFTPFAARHPGIF